MRLARAQLGERIVHGEIVEDSLRVYSADFLSGGEPTDESVALSDATLLAPTRPGKILLVLGGFLPADGTPLPPDAVPRLTGKVLDGDVLAPGDEIVIPRVITPPLWMEPEIAAVIGRVVFDATEAEARDAILGYTVFNDVSAPEFIYTPDMKPLPQGDYLRSKSVDTFAVMGPWIETSIDADDHARGIEIWANVNGEQASRGNSCTAKFPPHAIVQYLSQVMTLRPGDVVALGTPKPALAGPGDTVEIGVEGIGSIVNTIARRSIGR